MKFRPDVQNFQLTDEEFEVTRGELPDVVRSALRREGITARTTAFRKAAAAIRIEREFAEEYEALLTAQTRLAKLEGEQVEVERLRSENESLRGQISAREADLDRLTNRALRAAAEPYLAVSGD